MRVRTGTSVVIISTPPGEYNATATEFGVGTTGNSPGMSVLYARNGIVGESTYGETKAANPCRYASSPSRVGPAFGPPVVPGGGVSGTVASGSLTSSGRTAITSSSLVSRITRMSI